MQELGVKLTHALKALEQAKAMESQERDLRSVAEGWVVEARGRLYQCYHQSRGLSEQLITVQQCLSLLSAQAGLVQLPPGQSSLTSTAMDTLARMAGRVESLVALTDPSTPRATNNLTAPNKEKERLNMYHVPEMVRQDGPGPANECFPASLGPHQGVHRPAHCGENVDKESVERYTHLLHLLNDEIKAKIISELRNTLTEASHNELWSLRHDRGAEGGEPEGGETIIDTLPCTHDQKQQGRVLLGAHLEDIIIRPLKEKWQMGSELPVCEPQEACVSRYEAQAPQCDMDDIERQISAPSPCYAEPLPDLLPWTAQHATTPHFPPRSFSTLLPSTFQPIVAPQPIFHPEAQSLPRVLQDLRSFHPHPVSLKEALPPPPASLSFPPSHLCPHAPPLPSLPGPPQFLSDFAASSQFISSTSPPSLDLFFSLQSFPEPPPPPPPPRSFSQPLSPFSPEFSPSVSYSSQVGCPPPGFTTPLSLPFPHSPPQCLPSPQPYPQALSPPPGFHPPQFPPQALLPPPALPSPQILPLPPPPPGLLPPQYLTRPAILPTTGLSHPLPFLPSVQAYDKVWGHFEGVPLILAPAPPPPPPPPPSLQPVLLTSKDKIRTEVKEGHLATGGRGKVDEGRVKVDEGRTKVDEGREKVDGGRGKVDEGRGRVDEGRVKADVGRTKVDEGRVKVDEGRVKVDGGRGKVDEGRVKVDEGRGKVDEGRVKVDEGRVKVDEGRTKVDVGRGKVDGGRGKVDEGRGRVDEGRGKVDEGRAKVDEGRVKVDGGRGKVDEGRTRVDEGRTKVDEGRGKVDEGREKVDEGRGRVDEGRAKVDEGRGKVDEGRGKVDEGRAKVDEGRVKVDGGRGKVDEGRTRVDEGRTKVDEGRGKVDEGREKVDEGRGKVDEGRGKVDEGRTKVDEGRTRVDEGRGRGNGARAKVDTGTNKVDKGKKKLDKGKPRMNSKDDPVSRSKCSRAHNAQRACKVNTKEDYIPFVSRAERLAVEKHSDVPWSSEAWVTSEGKAEGATRIDAIPERDFASTHSPPDSLNTSQWTIESLDETFEDYVSEDAMIPVGALPSVDLPMPYVSPYDHVEEAVLSYAKNPAHFYLVLGREGTDTVQKLSEDLEEMYGDDDESLKVWELPIGSCWAVRWTDGRWYRGKVMANIAPKRKKSGWWVRVLLVDTGEDGEVPTQNIRVLDGIFALLPCQALPCHLVEVFPVQQWELEPWPSSTTQAFVGLCGGFRSPLTAHIHARCLDGTFGVILERSDGELVNFLMVRQGLATSQLLEELVESENIDEDMISRVLGTLEEEASESRHDELIPSEWDPMSEAYRSSSNMVYHDDECAETVLLGWRNTDEERQCKYHRAGLWCPRGKACPWEHMSVRRDVTVEKEKVLERGFLSCALPAKDSLVAVTVMSVTSPSHFYVHLHYGTKDLKCLVPGNQGDAELEVLLVGMQKHYSMGRNRRRRNPALGAPGELMVLLEGVPEKPDCSRVLVLEVDDCRDDGCRVKVFFLDLGYEEWVSDESLLPMPSQFAFLAPQAVECWLAWVDPPGDGWSPEAVEIFKEMVMGRQLFATVVDVDSDHQRVGVLLHEIDTYPDTFMNGHFLAAVLKLEDDEPFVIVIGEEEDVLAYTLDAQQTELG
ncbi:uncharacterized protein LOC127001294 isoform X4 [Eriocheir sinensis]|nr:uncharacterized protein LOC127001294 isoform X4 [Eriocheir sinensis]